MTLWGVARTGSCHFKRGIRGAEMSSYGEWQEPVLAILIVTQDRAERECYGEWQEPVLAII